jgi:hypothetical protein
VYGGAQLHILMKYRSISLYPNKDLKSYRNVDGLKEPIFKKAHVQWVPGDQPSNHDVEGHRDNQIVQFLRSAQNHKS